MSNWKGLSEDEVIHIKSILESPNDSRSLLEIFSDCLSKCLDEKEIESSIKIFLANYLSSHLDSLKLSLLIDVQDWIRRGLISSISGNYVISTISKRELKDLFVILGIYESGLQRNEEPAKLFQELEQEI